MPSSSPPDGQSDPRTLARTIVLRKLTAAPRTRAELAKALADRGIPPEIADEVLDRFIDAGLVDDAGLASTFADNRRTREGWSRRAIAAKLRDRGVPRDIVEDALSPMTATDEERTAVDLARRRWPQVARLDEATRRRRLAGVLARRGYDTGVVLAAIAAVEAEHEESGAILDRTPY